MKATILVRFVSINLVKTVQNVPTTCSISKFLTNIINSYFSGTDISNLKVVNSGRIINHSFTIGDLIPDKNNQIPLFISGPLNTNSNENKINKTNQNQQTKELTNNEENSNQNKNIEINQIKQPKELKNIEENSNDNQINQEEGKINENNDETIEQTKKYIRKERKVGYANNQNENIPEIPKASTNENEFNDDPDEIIVVEKQEKITKKKKESNHPFIFKRSTVVDPLRNPTKEKDDVSLSYFYKNVEATRNEKKVNSLTKLFVFIVIILSLVIGMECVIMERKAPKQIY